MKKLKHLAGDVLKKSELVKVAKQLRASKRSALFGAKVRTLKAKEIEELKQARNYSPDWSQVLVAQNFSLKRVWNSQFFGRCVLGSFRKQAVEVDAHISFPAGIYNATLVDAEIGNNCLIMNVGCLSNYVVEEGAVVFNVHTLTAEEDNVFGNGIEMPLAVESGGREVKSYAEITIPVAEELCTSRADQELLKEYEAFIKAYLEKIRMKRGVIRHQAIVKNTAKISSVYVGEGAVIDSVTLVENSTLLSSAAEPVKITDGAYVVKSIVQWGSHVGSMAIVDSSVLNEHSHVERHGKLTNCILGPNSGVAEGEATACLLGPFVGFHHQALLIAAYWPEGKGNVGYGANVGSNHTSKAPDQEIWCGEGTFFGLGTDIKFPSNFQQAPYSIIATGVTSLPQKVEFPFSLINTPAMVMPGLSPAFNEIMPGWVLSDNIFMVKRNEGKYKKRNKARRTKFIFDVFRPDIMDLVREARNRLQNVRQRKDYYTDRDIPGLGKNYLLENNRMDGINAYNFYLQYYALLGLKDQVATLIKQRKKGQAKRVLEVATKDPVWEHQRQLLRAELPSKTVPELLQQLIEQQEKIANDVQVSKEKDDRRGARIIPDYDEAHKPATEDGFVQETWAATKQLCIETEALLKAVK